MRLCRRTARPSPTIPIAPEFGVQVTLRKGDKVVRRDARGAIHIMRVTEERVELTDLGRVAESPPRAPRRG
jgi:hypothetical protein